MTCAWPGLTALNVEQAQKLFGELRELDDLERHPRYRRDAWFRAKVDGIGGDRMAATHVSWTTSSARLRPRSFNASRLACARRIGSLLPKWEQVTFNEFEP